MGVNELLPLKVSHQTYICVDEEGTELAAVTGGEMGMPLPDEDNTPKVKVDFNRPFMYIIRNSRTGAILMAGVVTNLED